MLATLKGTTPGDLEGNLPWDPGGEENVELKRACKASKDDVAGIDAPQQNTYLATQRITKVAPSQQSNRAPLPIFHPPIPPSRRRPILS